MSLSRSREFNLFQSDAAAVSSDASAEGAGEGTGTSEGKSAGDSLALRDFVQQQITRRQEELEQENSAQESNEAQLELETESFDSLGQEALPAFNQAFQLQHGGQLYGLDTEMNAGIEQYLPTPAVRLRIVKERLSRELIVVRGQLSRYEQMTRATPAIDETLAQLQKKQKTLEAHDAEVDEALNYLLSGKSTLTRATVRVNRVFQAGSLWVKGLLAFMGGLTPNKLFRVLNPDQAALVNANQELSAIQGVLSEQLNRENYSTADIGDLINAYDTSLVRVDALVERLEQRRTVTQLLKYHVSRWLGRTAA